MKLFRQIALLAMVALCFAAFDIAVYSLCTRRCLPDGDSAPRARVIELDKYLPFEEESGIVKVSGDAGFSGELPVIDGAEGLYPVFSAVVNALYPEDAVHFDGVSFTQDSLLQMNNTLRAYTGVVDGAADVIFCAAPSAQQLAYAEQKGVELELVPIGREAFVFIVNSNNPVDSLTVEQVRDIFSGKINNWSQVGGRPVPIAALQRIEGSGSQTALVSFMGGEPLARDYDVPFGSAIGFSFRYYVEDVIENGRVKLLALDSVYPNKENIINGNYPLVSSFYAVYDKANDNPNIPLLIDWLLSEQGQYVIEQTGYAPLDDTNSGLND